MCTVERHDPTVVAFHEAGHAVVTILVGWKERISEVAITPDDPKRGGYTKYNLPSGKAPINERFREISKRFAGPVSQVLFANETICEPYKSLFKTGVLDHLRSIDDLNRAKCPYWYSDLKEWLNCVAAEEEEKKAHFEPSNMCRPYTVSECFLRAWQVRPRVAKSIAKLAECLEAQPCLSGLLTRKLVEPLLESDDFVDEQTIENFA